MSKGKVMIEIKRLRIVLPAGTIGDSARFARSVAGRLAGMGGGRIVRVDRLKTGPVRLEKGLAEGLAAGKIAMAISKEMAGLGKGDGS